MNNINICIIVLRPGSMEDEGERAAKEILVIILSNCYQSLNIDIDINDIIEARILILISSDCYQSLNIHILILMILSKLEY